jgi:hypothetical protein
LRFLLTYRPEFNPIEMAFSCPQGNAQHQVKAFLKKTVARTINDLGDVIAQGVDAVAPLECENCFAAAGYDRD